MCKRFFTRSARRHKTTKENRAAKDYLLQEFIDYQVDLRVLAIGKKLFAMRRLPGKNEWRANFSLGGSVAPYVLEETDQKLARQAMKAVGLTIGGVDILISKNGQKYVLEVNHCALALLSSAVRIQKLI